MPRTPSRSTTREARKPAEPVSLSGDDALQKIRKLLDDFRSAMLTTLESAEFLADPRLRWRVPPSTSPGDPAFRARSYWRGPTWPVLTWLCWWALKRDGEDALADSLREASLDQIATVGFAEYVEPFTGDPLGSLDQSWTAAVAIDWLSA